MTSRFIISLAALGFFLISACEPDPVVSHDIGQQQGDGGTHTVCVPGSTQTCVCTNGAQGAQSCAENGATWLSCECAEPLDASTSDLAVADASLPDNYFPDTATEPDSSAVDAVLADLAEMPDANSSSDVPILQDSAVLSDASLGVDVANPADAGFYDSSLPDSVLVTDAAPDDAGPRTDAGFTDIGQTDAAQIEDAAVDAGIEDTTFFEDAGLQLDASSPDAGTSTEWTLLVWFAADNNLDMFSASDIAEMLDGMSSDDIHVVIEIDRSASYSHELLPGIEDFTDTRRFEVTASGLVPVGPFLGELDTGTPGVLADFISWGLQNYPAQKTALILWDHGGAWSGFGSDESSDPHGGLTLEAIDSALALGLSMAGHSKFDLLGFDACLMANLEAANQLSARASILVASEETQIANWMWDYRAIVHHMVSTANLTPQALASFIVDSYVGQYASVPVYGGVFGSAATLSVFDLDKMSALTSALDAVSNRLATTLIARSPWLAAARAQTRSQKYAFGAEGFNLRDLGDFLARLQAGSSDVVLQPLLLEAIQAYNDVVLYQLNGSARPGSTGITAFLPSDVASYHGYRSAYQQRSDFAATTSWTDFLDQYFVVAGQDTQAPQLDALVLTPENLSVGVSSLVQADDLNNIYLWSMLMTGEDTFKVVGVWPFKPAPSGDISLHYPYAVGVLSYEAQQVLVAPIYDYVSYEIATENNADVFDSFIALIPASVLLGSGAIPTDGHLVMSVSEDGSQYTITAFRFKHDSGLVDLPILEGMEIFPKYISVDPSGARTEVSSTKITIGSDSALLKYNEYRLQVNNMVYLAMTATDFSGNSEFVTATAPVRVRGKACTDHDGCEADEFCDPVDKDCRPAYGTQFVLNQSEATLSSSRSWDALGGAPDPFACWSVDGVSLGCTEAISDNYSAAWTGTVDVTLQAGQVLRVDVWDNDLTDPDWAGAVEFNDWVQFVRWGGVAFNVGGDLVDFQTAITPK